MFVVDLPFDIAVLVAAFAAMLVYYGAKQLFGSFTEGLDWLLAPILNFFTLPWDLIFEPLIARQRTLVENTVTFVAHVIAAPPEGLTQLVDAIIHWAEAVVVAILAGPGTVVTVVTDVAIGLVQTAVAALRTDVDNLFNVYMPNLQWFIEAVQKELWDFVRPLAAQVASIEERMLVNGPTLEGIVAALIGLAIDGAKNEIMGLVHGIEAGINNRVDAVDRSIDGHVTAKTDPLAREIAGVRTALADAIPGIDTKIKEAVGPVALAGELTATAVTTIERWINDCGEPLCENFTPQIPALKDLVSLIETGLVATWLYEAIADPEGTADFTDSFVQAPLASVADTLGLAA